MKTSFSNFSAVNTSGKIGIEPLLRATDVARYLNISRTQAYRLMREEEINVVRFGGSVRCTLDALEEFVKTHSGGGNG